MENALLKIINELPGVSRVNAWNDRHYVTVATQRGVKFRGDMNAKIWLKGNELVVERTRGITHSTFDQNKAALIEAVKAAGGTVIID